MRIVGGWCSGHVDIIRNANKYVRNAWKIEKHFKMAGPMNLWCQSEYFPSASCQNPSGSIKCNGHALGYA